MNKINFYENFDKILKNKKIKLVPLTLAISLLGGCGYKEKADKMESHVMTSYTNFISEFYRKKNTLDCYFEQWGFEYEGLGENYYRIKKDCKNNIIYCASLDEFKNYVDIKNPTFDDIRNLLAQNSNISGEYQEWLLEGINNLEENAPDLELVALYYNLKRISIVEKTTKEIVEKIGTSGAYFKVETGEVVINPETVSRYTLCHEILGHGISDIEIDSNGTTVHYMPNCKALYVNLDTAEYKGENIGLSLEEGKADLISDIATNCTSGGPYDAQAEQLRIFNEVTNTSLADFANNGVIGLINNMKKSDIDNPLIYISNVDCLLEATRKINLDIPTEYTIKHNIVEFFKDFADDKVENGTDKEEIKETISKVLAHSNYIWINAGETFVFDSVSVETLKQESLSNIDKLDNNKQLIK